MSDQPNSNQNINNEEEVSNSERKERNDIFNFLFILRNAFVKYYSFERQNSGRTKFFIKLSEFLIKTAC